MSHVLFEAKNPRSTAISEKLLYRGLALNSNLDIFALLFFAWALLRRDTVSRRVDKTRFYISKSASLHSIAPYLDGAASLL